MAVTEPECNAAARWCVHGLRDSKQPPFPALFLLEICRLYKHIIAIVVLIYKDLDVTYGNMQTCSDSWTCSWRFLMTASSSSVLPSVPGATGRACSCFSTDSLSSACSLEKTGVDTEELYLRGHSQKNFKNLLNSL